MTGNRVLIVGGGGREHALVWKLAQSPEVDHILVAPGNAGTAAEAENIAIAPEDIRALADLVEARNIDLTVIGPEAPLALGLADILRARNRLVFGPDASGARLEASKAFAKHVMNITGVPTACHTTFTELELARAYLSTARYPLVIKADALAAGKGVVICDSEQQALETLDAFMIDRVHGVAGARVVIEDALVGPEVSLLALVDGEVIVPLPIAQDHKRLRNGDQGPNTGGMGAYAPVPFVDAAERARLIDLVMRPVLTHMARAGNSMTPTGRPYRGILYAGLMLTADGPMVLEFNCRFGDPEAQVIIPLIEDDLLPWLLAVATGDLAAMPAAIRVSPRQAVGVVLAAPGYPCTPRVGDRIDGLPGDTPDIHVFHGTTTEVAGEIVTAGGRNLTIVGVGDTLAEARQRAYSAPVAFPNMQFRADIARRTVGRRARIGVLAAGAGSNLLALLTAMATRQMEAEVAIVISSSNTAEALEHARQHNVPAVALHSVRSLHGEDRLEYDQRLLRHLLPFELDLLVLAGWMRVLSPNFLAACPFPVINVHPALLSADGSDKIEIEGHVLPVLRGIGAVRRAVALGLPYTGVTIHHVTNQVDAGPIILQQVVAIEPAESETTLYHRIKPIEHRLIVEATSLVLSSAQTGVIHA